MNEQFNKDRASRPDLFHPFGSVSIQRLDAWLHERNYFVPDDLIRFWVEFGGMDMFESETVLGPFGRVNLGDDIESVNRLQWSKGMPSNYLIFHTGIDLTVIKMPSGEYLNIREPSYEVQQTFDSLADWYGRLIRKEYASRYGLT